MSLFFLLPTSYVASVSLPPDESRFHQSNTSVQCFAGWHLESSTDKIYIVGTTGPGNLLLTKVDLGTYIQSGISSDYWFRCTLNSGTLAPGADNVDTWYQATADLAWYVQDTTADDGSVDANFTIEVATDSGGSNIIASETYTPTADYITL